jgi:hypothetical protein
MLDSLDLSFEDSPVTEVDQPYFAVGGGYIFTVFYPNFDDLNNMLTTNGFPFGEKIFETPVFMHGAQVFTAVGIIPNTRVGFFWNGGTKLLEKDIAGANLKQSFEYSVDVSGLSLNYAWVPFSHFAVLPGVNTFWGRIILESYQTQKNVEWGVFKPGADTTNFLNRAEAGFLYVQPNVSVEYAITVFAAIRLNAGYTFSFMQDWEFNRNAKINDGSLMSNFNADGFSVQLGLFIGLFSY